ncbi:lysophospholipid acyltransferase family protein [Marinivivus vitaminiproducens]|uniref:lysophospholipid acyltransferase family protein n=1 Tax=Marinivivus vitaminiproducens TaxID=3035935 RepID=UPI0027AA07AF|nr:hypothetical protein P4R82_14130 [Geminicoccaceae bacterium SCSIO 64248]
MARTMFGKRVDRIIRRRPWLMQANLRVEAAIMRTVWTVFGLMPPDLASRIGGGVLAAVGPHLRKSRHVRANLRTALPEAADEEIERHVREVWETLGRVIAEYPHVRAIAEGRYGPRIEEVFQPGAEKEILAAGPAIYVGGHFGNWEFSPITTFQPDFPMALIFSTQRNPYVDAMLLRWRSSLGPEYIPKESSLSVMSRAIAKGRSIGLLMDQRVDAGESLPFFGHDALTSTVPIRLAVRQNVPIIPVRVERIKDATFRITVHTPIPRDPALTDPRDQARYLATEINKVYERWIRERPGQWMCLKQRWLDRPRRSAAARPARTVEA